MKPLRRLSAPTRQRGLTLVEFMVALVVGMLVVLAATAGMLGTRGTSLTRDDVSGLQQTSALVFRVVGQQVRQAGYIPIDANGTPLYYFDVNESTPTQVESAPRFFAVSGEDGKLNDTLTIGYAPTPDYFADCNGQAANYDPANPAAPKNQRVIASRFSVNTAGTLTCLGSGSAVPQPIAEGVERFEVRYGIGAAMGDERVSRYVKASEVGNFRLVRVVRICLQLVGSWSGHPGTEQYTDCEGESRSASDGRLRRVYTTAIGLRNNLGAL